MAIIKPLKSLTLKNDNGEDTTYVVASAPAIVETTEPASVASFPDGAEGIPVKSLLADINPVQNLNGQSAPYPAGGGKNKLPITATTSTVSGVTFTVNADGTISTSGTASAGIVFNVCTETIGGTNMTLSGCPSGGSDSGYYMTARIGGAWSSAHDTGSGLALYGTVDRVAIVVSNGTNMNSKTFSPMVRANGTDPSYAPYSNICPITGWTGMNVYRSIFCKRFIPTSYSAGDVVETKNGVTVKYLGDGKYHLFGTNTSSSTTNLNPVAITSFTTQTQDDEHRIFAFNNNATGSANINFRSNGTWLLNAAFNAVNRELTYTSTMTGKEITDFFFSVSANATVDIICTPTFYDKNNTPLPISWADEAGTVYGGTLDVTTGLLTVNMASVDLGTLTWGASSSANCFYAPSAPYYAYGQVEMMCSNYAFTGARSSAPYYGDDKTIQAFWRGNESSPRELYVHDSAYSTAAAFQTAMSGVQLVYELATPQTYQLTPQAVLTILGQNNIWADTGDVEVAYCADTKMYIDKMISEL